MTNWKRTRRVILTRRRLSKTPAISAESPKALSIPYQCSIWEPPEEIAAYEYAVLITSLTDEPLTIVQHYRDRADCENNFDEIKNHWGWGGFVTQKITPCRLVARMIALIYITGGHSLFDSLNPISTWKPSSPALCFYMG